MRALFTQGVVILAGLGAAVSGYAQDYSQGQAGDYQQGQQQQQQQQGQPPQPQGQRPAAPQVELSEKKISKFSDAYAKISTIRQDYTDRMRNAEDQSKARELQQQAQSEMMAAVKETGLSVQDYNRIAQAIQRNPELRNRVLNSSN